MRIAYFCGGARGLACLRQLLRDGHTIAGVVASSGDPELERQCREHGLTLLVERQPNSEPFAARLAALGADLFVCSGYNRILKPLIFGIPPRGTLNLHGGRLPDYRGAAPINWQIINGESEGGCCVLFMDAGIDTGPIARQERYPIAPDDTHQSLLERTLDIFPRLLADVLRDMERGVLQAVPQDPGAGCHYSRRYPEDSRIDWAALSDREVHNLVRGMFGPYPHAFTERDGERIEIERTSLLADSVKGVPGRAALKRPEGVVVLCRNRGLLVEEVRHRGRRLPAREVMAIGDKFG